MVHCKYGIAILVSVSTQLVKEGTWVFLGLPNAVKAFNVQTSKDLHLNGVVGQVHAMTVGNRMLFAGTSSGSISVWKATDSESEDPFTYLTSCDFTMVSIHSLEERGKMFSRNTVGTITIGPEGCGDKCGKLRIWSLAGTKVQVLFTDSD